MGSFKEFYLNEQSSSYQTKLAKSLGLKHVGNDIFKKTKKTSYDKANRMFPDSQIEESKKIKYSEKDFENYGLKGINWKSEENQKKLQYMLDKAKEMNLEHIMNKTWREKDRANAEVYHYSWSRSSFG